LIRCGTAGTAVGLLSLRISTDTNRQLIETLQSRFKFHSPPTHLDGYRNIDKRTYWSLTFRSVEEAGEPGRFIGTKTDLFQHADAGALSIAGADNLLDVKMLRREWVKLLRIE
jgi:hypothetical protein